MKMLHNNRIQSNIRHMKQQQSFRWNVIQIDNRLEYQKQPINLTGTYGWKATFTAYIRLHDITKITADDGDFKHKTDIISIVCIVCFACNMCVFLLFVFSFASRLPTETSISDVLLFYLSLYSLEHCVLF